MKKRISNFENIWKSFKRQSQVQYKTAILKLSWQTKQRKVQVQGKFRAISEGIHI